MSSATDSESELLPLHQKL
nr:hypothetical protein [Yersinia pestis]